MAEVFGCNFGGGLNGRRLAEPGGEGVAGSDDFVKFVGGVGKEPFAQVAKDCALAVLHGGESVVGTVQFEGINDALVDEAFALGDEFDRGLVDTCDLAGFAEELSTDGDVFEGFDAAIDLPEAVSDGCVIIKAGIAIEDIWRDGRE